MKKIKYYCLVLFCLLVSSYALAERPIGVHVMVESHFEYEMGEIKENPDFVDFEDQPPCSVGDVNCNHDYYPQQIKLPKYPRRAARKLQEATCFAMYSISEAGKVSEIKLVECDSDVQGFTKAIRKTIKKYKYFPRVVKGNPESVGTAVSRYIFTISGYIER